MREIVRRSGGDHRGDIVVSGGTAYRKRPAELNRDFVGDPTKRDWFRAQFVRAWQWPIGQDVQRLRRDLGRRCEIDRDIGIDRREQTAALAAAWK
jgi:hypothetical protein